MYRKQRMYRVIKRNGKEVEFNIKKIVNVIRKAFDAAKVEYADSVIDYLALRVSSEMLDKQRDGLISVETIQDVVESVLAKSGYDQVAKEYILYRKNRENVRKSREALINYKETVDKYLKVEDWRVKENSTVNYSIGGLILSNSGAITANYWLHEIYDKETADAHRNCDLHIHDLSMLAPYCAGWNLKQLITEGLGGVPGKITSSPAQHLSTLCNQMVNFLGILQNEWAGAQAFSSFDTYLAPFVKIDNLSYKDVKQALQSFIYGVNTPSRWGTQAPFSNITLDWTVPEDLKYLPAIVGGVEQDFTYGDCIEEMAMVNKAFIEIMIEGDANGRGFQYPIPTYSITRDFDWSPTENNKLLFEMTAKYGTPYFSNYVNSDMSPNDVRSMCLMPNTMVWCKVDGHTKHIAIEELFNHDINQHELMILTKHGYRPIKELQRFAYSGKMLNFTLDDGKEICTTPDHEHVVYNKDHRTWYTNGKRKALFKYGKEPNSFRLCNEHAIESFKLIKKKAADIEVGDVFSVRTPNAGERRKGLTYEQCYGEEKAKQLRDLYSEQRAGRWSGEKNPSYGGLSKERRENISKAMIGHYVSEHCKRKSSERWSGKNNPYKKSGKRVAGRNIVVGHSEDGFIKELDALGLNYIYQYKIPELTCISDFYIPEKNLVIELETDYRWDICAYNNTDMIYHAGLKKKYNAILGAGYNLLVFNPKLDNSSYRPYINKSSKVVSIDEIDYSGSVYDLEVDCDDIEGNTELYHTFYANEILTGNCCRLRLDLRELRKKSGGFFGSGENTGSIGVVTLNLPRLAYLAKSEEEFYQKLDHLMDLAAKSLKTKRTVVEKLLENGLYPYTKRYLGHFNNHFSTIGLVGMNEAGLNACWIRKDMTSSECQEFAKNVLDHMREKLSDYQELYGDLYNLEATPAESTSYRLALHDKKAYPDIITASEASGVPYYTNSSHLPVGYTEDIFDALDVQDELQTRYTSGTVFHAFLGEKLPTWESAAKLVRTIAENYKLPYYTMSPTYSVCKDHGYLVGEQFTCPVCGNATEVYSRITGYYRPVQNWNAGKTQEFADRKEYSISASHFVEKSQDTVQCEEKHDDVNTKDKAALLIATPTCPNCKIACQYLDRANFTYKKIYATDNKEIVDQYSVKQAPTLIVFTDDSYEKYSGAGAIKHYLETKEQN